MQAESDPPIDPAAPCRFVVLHHTGVAQPHFDLLFEWSPGELLTSFRCPRWPAEVGDEWEEMPEHRRLYLDYEGPVSGDRGEVMRVLAGESEVEVLVADPPTLALLLEPADRPCLAITLVHSLADNRSLTVWTVTAVQTLAH